MEREREGGRERDGERGREGVGGGGGRETGKGRFRVGIERDKSRRNVTSQEMITHSLIPITITHSLIPITPVHALDPYPCTSTWYILRR